MAYRHLKYDPAWQLLERDAVKTIIGILVEMLYPSLDSSSQKKLTMNMFEVHGKPLVRVIEHEEAWAVVKRLCNDVGPTDEWFGDLGNRPDMAHPALLRCLDVYWEVATHNDSLSALDKWLDNNFNVSSLRFLREDQVCLVMAGMLQEKWARQAKPPSSRRATP